MFAAKMKTVNKTIDSKDAKAKKNMLELQTIPKLEREATRPTAKLNRTDDRITLQQK